MKTCLGRIFRTIFLITITLCIFEPGIAQKKILKGTPSWGQSLQSKIYIQNIYKKEYINRTGYITKLTFYPVTDPDPMMNFCNGTINEATIFIGETGQNSYNGSNWVRIDSLSPVYSGKIAFNCDSVEILLNRPVYYSGNYNLVFSFLFENNTGNVSLKRSENIGYTIISSDFDNAGVIYDPPIPSNSQNKTINLGVVFSPSCPDYFWVYPQNLNFSNTLGSKDSLNVFTNGSLNYSISYLPSWLKRENVINSEKELFSTNTPNESYTSNRKDSIILEYSLNNERIVIETIQNAVPIIEELENYSIFDTVRVIKSFDFDNDYFYEYLCMSTKDFSYSILKREGNSYKKIKIGSNTFAGELSNVIIEDINHDNNPDIIILEGSGPFVGRVVILYNKLTYFESPAITIEPLSTDLKLIDLDNDGDKDIIVSGIITDYFNNPHAGEAKVRFYENKNNSFLLREDVKLTDAIGKNSPYDFDNDGDVDIIMSGSDINGNTNTYLLLNNGNWEFSEKQTNIKGYCSGETISGDLNSDGLTDAVTIGALCFNQNGEVIIYNQSTGNTFTKQDYLLPKYPKGEIKLGDINSDGKLDLLASTYDEWRTNSTSDIYLNSQTSFTKGNYDLIKLNYSINLVLTDISGDNNLDFILSGVHNQKNTAIFYNNNTQKINTTPSPPDSIWASTSLDNVTFNWNDGNDNETPVSGLTYNFKIGTTRNGNEIVSSNSHNDGKRKIFEFGNAYQNNSWQIKKLSPGKYYWSVQTIDNSYVGSQFAKVDSFIIHNVFELQTTNLQAITYGNSRWADLDNDSDPDLILMGGTDMYVNPKSLTNIYYNDKGNFLHNASDTITGMFNTNPGLKVTDVDNDNLIDIIVCGSRAWSGTLKTKIFRNTGNGFVGLPFEVTSEYGTTIDVADFNNDGLIDIVFSNAKTFIYFNKGNGQFVKSSFELGGYQNGGIKAVDIDNDQDYDLILINDSYDQSKIYVNNGGIFTSIFSFPFFTSGSIGIIDFNNDNYFDFIVHGNSIISGSYGNSTVLYKNTSGKQFTKYDTHIRGVSFSDVEIGDYNNDGWSDLVIAGNSSNRITRLYKNNSGTDFSDIEIPFFATSYGSLSFADIYKDGTLDLLVTGGDGNGFIKLYRNFGDWRNDPPGTPVSPKATLDGTKLKLSWGRASDKQSGSNGLTYNLRVGSSPGGNEIISPLSDPVTGYRKIMEPGNTQMNTGWHLDNLPKGIYYWSVQAIDQSFAGGGWTPEQTFKISLVSASFSTDTVCFGSATNFIDKSFTSGSSINSWKWDFGDGATSTIQNPAYVFKTPGTHTVKLIVSSLESADTLSILVPVLPKPSAAFSVDPVCHGKESVFVNSSSVNGLTISIWLWDLGDGQSSFTQDPPSHFYAQPGNYKTKLTVSALNGCSDTLTKFARVGEYPVVILSADGPTEFCAGKSVTFSVDNKATYSYQWNLNDLPLTGAGKSSLEANASGVYFVNVSNTVASCLSSSPKASVTVIDKPAKPLVTYSGPANGICPTQEQITLNIDQVSSAYNYQWKRNGVPIDKAIETIYSGEAKTGIYTVSAWIKGCATESNEVSLTLKEAFPKPELYVQGPVVWYMAASNDSADTYTWFRNNEIIPGADKYLYVANKQLGTYKVEIKNKSGCVTMSDDLTIPVTKGEMTKFSIPQKYMVGEDIDPFENLKIYPNPTPGMFTIEMDNSIFGELDIKIFTNEGRQLLNIKFEKTTEHFATQVDLSGNPKGMYLVNLMIERYNANRKLIVE